VSEAGKEATNLFIKKEGLTPPAGKIFNKKTATWTASPDVKIGRVWQFLPLEKNTGMGRFLQFINYSFFKS
jgi:hypothetical protein